jgi:hypothetical protein
VLDKGMTLPDRPDSHSVEAASRSVRLRRRHSNPTAWS